MPTETLFLKNAIRFMVLALLCCLANAQNSYPVPKSTLAALAAEQAKIPPRNQVLRQLQVEQSKLPPVHGIFTSAEISNNSESSSGNSAIGR